VTGFPHAGQCISIGSCVDTAPSYGRAFLLYIPALAVLLGAWRPMT
jgi:hypothetical protein